MANHLNRSALAHWPESSRPTPVGQGSFANYFGDLSKKAASVQEFQFRNIPFLHSTEISAEPKIQFGVAEELRDAVWQFSLRLPDGHTSCQQRICVYYLVSFETPFLLEDAFVFEDSYMRVS